MTTTSRGFAVRSSRRSWNDTATSYERDLRIEAVVRARVDEDPEGIAVIDGGRSVSYRQLWNGAAAVAQHLRALQSEAKRDDAEACAAVVADRSLETIVSFLGVLLAGMAYVPIDPDLPLERQRFILQDTAACVVLCPRHLREIAEELVASPIIIGDVVDDIAGDAFAPIAAVSSLVSNSPAYVMYTSGSTGRPKGVLVEHRGVLRYVRGAASLAPLRGEAVLCAGHLGFDLTSYEIWSALTNGGRVVLSPPGRFDPAAVATSIEHGDVAVAFFSTGMFHSLVDNQLHRLSNLRLVLVGGDVLSPLHARRFVEAHPRCRLVNAYGPTETTVTAAVFEVADLPTGETVPIGRPLDNTTLYVLDEHRRPVAPGEVGELYIGGDGVARGYLNLPDLTAERFIVDPFEPGPGRHMYRSGDRVRLRDDGELEFLGRFDDQVKVRGFRVEPAEVESVLLANESVGQVVVIAREEVPGHKRLVGYVVPASPTTAESLRTWCADRLPDFAVPSAIVLLDALPLNELGKVDRRALPAPLSVARVPESLHPPTTPSELVVEREWRAVLGVASAATEDDFFEAGGDSLLALALLAGIRSETDIELPISTLFELRSLGALAAALELANPPEEMLAGRGALSQLPNPGVMDGPTAASIGQAQVCFLSELAVDALPYQSQAVVWLEGVLNVAALETALFEVVCRHEILRTALPSSHGVRMLRVMPEIQVSLPVVDLADTDNPDQAFSRFVDRCVAEQIDLDRAPLLRWTLVRLAERRHALVQVEHHAVHDGVSFALFLGELARAYEDVLEERPQPPTASLQYSDFARWQREYVDSPEGRAQLSYWRVRLHAPPPPLQLPTTFRRPRALSSRGRSIRHEIDPKLFEGIRQLASSFGATPYMVMMSAFALLMERMSGQDDFIVGSGLANRRVRGSEKLLGMLVNTAALRFELDPLMSVADLIRQARERCLETYENQELPFEAVIRELAPERDGGHSPLYRHMFSFHDAPLPELELPGLSIIARDALSNGSAKADLNVIVVNRRHLRRSHAAGWTGDPAIAPEDERPSIVWEYASDLYDDQDARALLERYLVLLGSMVSDTAQALSSVSMLSDDERASLVPSKGRALSIDRATTIDSLFRGTVRAHPERIAISATEEELTYAELDLRVEHLADELQARGVGPGHFVGVVDDRTIEMIVSLLAVLRAGAAYVGLDAAMPHDRFEHVVELTAMSLVCVAASTTSGPLVERLVNSANPTLLSVRASENVESVESTRVGAAPSADDLAYVSFTSGSTGEPKGVEISHRGVVRLVHGADYVRLDTTVAICAMAPLSFDASTFEIWGALLNGARLVLAPAGPLSAAEIAGVLEREGVTTLFLTSALFHEMVEHEPAALASLNQLLTGGDVLSVSHVNLALDAMSTGAVLVAVYGPTETTTFASFHVMPAGSRIDQSVPIGVPIANTSLCVLDAAGEPVPVGVVGELYIGGDGVARGYLGRPELTAERFVTDRFDPDPSARLYRSGDLVRRRRDGVFEFVGRLDRQVKIRGFRIEPAEVEYALSRHPDVAQSLVTVVAFGRDDRRLVAYLKASPRASCGEPGLAARGERPVDEELRRHLGSSLPRYMWPYAFVWLDEFPRTSTGKIDPERLPRPPLNWVPSGDSVDASNPAPHARVQLRRDRAQASNRLQLRLVEVFQEVLGVRPVGLDDNFFDLGGHSLLAVALFAEIERVTGARLPLSVIFEAPTVAGLADVLREGGWDAAFNSLVPLTTTGTRTPLFLVTAGDGNTVGFGALARRIGPEQPFYALQPRGLDGRSLLMSSVKRMARHYVGEIRAAQPHGPYLLGGRCFGTLVAYEMTRRLEAAGEKVAVLFALDSVGPLWEPRVLANGLLFDEVMNLALTRAGERWPSKDDFFTERAVADAFIDWLQETVSEFDGARITRYLHAAWLARPDLQHAYPLDAGGHAGLLYWAWVGGRTEMGMNAVLLGVAPSLAIRARPSVDPRRLGLWRRLSARLLDVVDVGTRGRLPQLIARRQARLLELATLTLLDYRGGPIDAPVALIRSEEYRDDAQVARWFGVSTGGVDEFFVAGTHLSMVREPDVASLAEAMSRRIEQLDGRAGSRPKSLVE